MSEPYPRDMTGYGRTPPHAQWPGDARIAVEFVINYEEGRRTRSSTAMHGVRVAPDRVRLRDTRASAIATCPIESMYEYGSRVGFWRLHRLFAGRQIPITVFGVAMALERNPDARRRDGRGGLGDREPRLSLDRPLRHARGDRARAHPQGRSRSTNGSSARGRSGTSWAGAARTPCASSPRRAASSTARTPTRTSSRTGWSSRAGRCCSIPYTADVNDHRFTTAPGFDWGAPFFEYARDAFDVLYAEGERTPKLMAIGLHSRLVGRPGRFRALERFVEHVTSHDGVWLCRGIDIAEHWRANFPAPE